jgi:hypothetical protein
MTIIHKYKIEDQYYDLKKIINNLELISDSLTFRMTIIPYRINI